MTLKLDSLMPQLDRMGEVLAGRQQQDRSAILQARAWLRNYADDFDTLAPLAGDHHVPAPTESLNAIHPLPPIPERLTIIGSDGSVIPPDRHGAALYHLINVGGLIFRRGSGETPQVFQTSRLAFSIEDLYEGARLIEGNLLDIRRDLAELRALADCVETECETGADVPLVALADGTLLLWVLEESPPEKRQSRIDAYLDELDRLAALQVPVAGFISRPRYRAVLRLLWLSHLHKQGTLGTALPADDPFLGLRDGQLFADLPAGARTGLFISPSPVNTFYRARHHQIHFFYLNVGKPDEPEIARLEVPSWVAQRKELLDRTQTTVVDQCRIPGGYPYVLARAHEQALVTTRERRHLEQLVMVALRRHGLDPRPSRKAWMKELTGSARRRHRL